MNSAFNHHLGRPLVLALSLLSLSRVASGDPAFDSFFSNNGSFEFGSSGPPFVLSGSPPSSAQITGWTFQASDSSLTLEWLENADAQNGNRYIHLTSPGGLGGWYSGGAISGTAPFVVGDQYLLSFWAAGGVAAQNQLDLAFNSAFGAEGFNIALPTYTQTQFDALGSLAWQQYFVPFTASDTAMQLSLSAHPFSGAGHNNSIYLDNFSIAAIPEPGSVMLVGLAGVLAVAGARRRRMVVG